MLKSLRLYLVVFLLLISSTVKAQVLISLLFGDKLNSEKIEFGLIGGFNWSNLPDLAEAEALSNFNLGFYFHFKMHENSFFSTGVLVKSNLGAGGLTPNTIGQVSVDSLFKEGELIKELAYFHVPVLYHYRIKRLIYLEAGFQAGLRSRATDVFKKSAFGGDALYTRDTKKEYNPLDFGLLGGIGAKFNQQSKGMSIGLRYYYGLTNINALDGPSLRNTSVYLFFKVPIGLGKEKPKSD